MKLLFFSHTCARTGSELALHRLICNADRTNTTMAVACGAGGVLAKSFPGDVRVFNYSHALSFGERVFKHGTPGLKVTNSLFKGSIRLIHQRVRPDAWYINTIMQPSVLALAREMNVPCILHSHEYELMLPLLKPADIELMISYPKLIIAGSECGADVMRVLGRRENLEVCYESIDVGEIKAVEDRTMEIRQRLKIPPQAFVWAMSGTRDINKNPAGFVRIACELLKQEPDTYFLWIGGIENGYSSYAKALSKRFNIDDKIIWVPEQIDDYFNYQNVASGFLLTSLNESLSIVTLEAAALGKPFVSFDSGGPREIFREGMGVVVKSWNVEDMAKAMLQVMRGEIYVNAEISRARAGEFDISVIVKRWEAILQAYMLESASAT